MTVAASMRGPPGVKVFFADLSSKGSSPTHGRRHTAFSLPPSFLRKVFACPSPTRPASIRTLYGAVCPGASWSPSSQNGRCHLRTELSRPRFRKRSFRRDLAVTRTRRLATKPNYIVLSCLLRSSRRPAVAQRLVHFPTHPQPVQQHRQLPRDRVPAGAGGFR